MASRKIRIYGDPILRLKAKSITEFGEQWLPLIEDMYDSCEVEEGAGLAAPQIGESIRLVVIFIRRENEEPVKMAVFNPEILEKEGSESYEEGCLSIPGIRENVVRPTMIRLKFQDHLGNFYDIWADGILARVLQHEIDHLNGVMFVDHLSIVKKMVLKSKLKDLSEGILPED